MTDKLTTFTGRKIDLRNVDASDIDIRDVAWSLAQQCRFGGHCQSFYSVAEHCLLVTDMVDRLHGRWALLHDAAEAYLGDLARPVKALLPEFEDMETLILRAIAERFGLEPDMPEEVAVADNQALRLEEAELMSKDTPLNIGFVRGYTPAEAFTRFLAKADQLGLA